MVKEQTLKGKSAIITGGSAGIGRATALRLAREGCNIFLVARRKKQLEELKEEIASLNVHVEYASGDVTQEDFSAEVVLKSHEKFGQVDILVLSAGVSIIKAFNMTSIDDFQSLMDVNLFGAINFCKQGTKMMSTGGSIILITSPSGIYGAKGMSAYSASKGAIISFGKCLALELSVKKIRVNIILPGFVETGMTERLYGRLNEAQKKQIKDAHPLGIGSANYVANAINFLVSDEASWITGIVMPVDGGFTTGI